MSRARHKKGGKVVSEAQEGGVVTPHPGVGINPHAGGKRAAGGKVCGKMGKMRLDRPGRKRGGRVGADMAPLSTANAATGPEE